MRRTIWFWRAVGILPLYATQATWTFVQSTFDGLLRTLDSIIGVEVPSVDLGPLFELCSRYDTVDTVGWVSLFWSTPTEDLFLA